MMVIDLSWENSIDIMNHEYVEGVYASFKPHIFYGLLLMI